MGKSRTIRLARLVTLAYRIKGRVNAGNDGGVLGSDPRKSNLISGEAGPSIATKP
jgi:hypothetical protein